MADILIVTQEQYSKLRSRLGHTIASEFPAIESIRVMLAETLQERDLLAREQSQAGKRVIIIDDTKPVDPTPLRFPITPFR